MRPNHKKNRGCIVVGPYDLRAKYKYHDRVHCELHELHANGDCDVAVTALGIGETESEALADAIETLRRDLAAGRC